MRQCNVLSSVLGLCFFYLCFYEECTPSRLRPASHSTGRPRRHEKRRASTSTSSRSQGPAGAGAASHWPTRSQTQTRQTKLIYIYIYTYIAQTDADIYMLLPPLILIAARFSLTSPPPSQPPTGHTQPDSQTQIRQTKLAAAAALGASR